MSLSNHGMFVIDQCLFYRVYKKAGLLKAKKEHVEYVVAKRGAGRKVSRPAGVKGKFKVVDPRMKKDNMHAKKTAKKQRQGCKVKGGGSGGKKRR